MLLLTPVVLRRGAQLGSDIPACVFLLLVCHVLIASATRSRWITLWLAPLGAAAYYLRYGSIVALGCLAVVFAIIWRDQLRRLLVPLILTGLLFAALLIPHVLDSIEKTGSPLGIFVLAGKEAHRRYLGEGLVYYLGVWWWRDVGPVMTLLLAYGAVATIRTTDRTVRFLGLSSLAMIAVYGVSTHGESRYVLLPMVLLGLIGAQRLGLTWRFRWLSVLSAIAVATAAVSIVVTVNLESPRAPHLGAQMVTWIRKNTPATPCATLSLHHRQVAWYTQCQAFSPDNYDFENPAPVFVLVFSEDRMSVAMARTIEAAALLAFGPGVLVYRFPGRRSASPGQ